MDIFVTHYLPKIVLVHFNNMKRIRLATAIFVMLSSLLAADEKPTTVVCRGVEAWPVLNSLEFARAGITVAMIKPHDLRVPADVRFRKMECRQFLMRVAEFNGLKPVWVNHGTGVILQRGASEVVVTEILRGFSATDEKTLRDTAWKTRWIEDVRVLAPLAGLCSNSAAPVANQAWISLLDLGMTPLVLMNGTNALPVLELACNGKDLPRKRTAISVLGFTSQHGCASAARKGADG